MVHMYMCVHVWAYVYPNVHIYAYIYVCVHMYIVFVHMGALLGVGYTCPCASMCVDTHVCGEYMYVYVCVRGQKKRVHVMLRG